MSAKKRALIDRLTQLMRHTRQGNIGRLLSAIDNYVYERVGPIRVLVAFFDWHLSSIPPLMLLAEELSHHAGIELRILNLSAGQPDFEDEQQSKLYRQYSISDSLAFISKWHYIITTTPAVPDKFIRDSINITIQHGSAFGRGCLRGAPDVIVEQASNPLTDIVFGLSRIEYQYLNRIRPDVFAQGKRIYFPVGSPKTDPLFSGKYDRGEFLNSLGLDPQKKTILVSSHWCQPSILRTFGPDIVEHLGQLAPEHNILVSGHPLIWHQPWYEGWNTDLNRDALIKNMEKATASISTARFLRPLAEYSLLNAADLLIADHSSILPQFCLLDRPILFFDNPAVDFDREIHGVFCAASECFSELEQVAAKCRFLLDNPQQHAAGRAVARKYFFSNPGHASQYAVKTIMELGRMCSKDSPRWTLAAALAQTALEADL